MTGVFDMELYNIISWCMIVLVCFWFGGLDSHTKEAQYKDKSLSSREWGGMGGMGGMMGGGMYSGLHLIKRAVAEMKGVEVSKKNKRGYIAQADIFSSSNSDN